MRWILIGLVFIAVVSLASCAGISKRPGLLELVTGYPETTLRIVSFNVDGSESDAANHPWSGRRELVAQRLAETNADIIALQDASPAQVRELLASLPGYAVAMNPEVDATPTPIVYRTDALRVSSLTAFAISPTPRVIGSIGWGSRLARSASSVTFEATGGHLVRVINAHLAEDSDTARQRGADLLARAISEGGQLGVPVILAGSFGDTQSSPALALLTGQSDEGVGKTITGGATSPRLLDSFRVRSTQTEGVGTSTNYHASEDAPRTDYLLVDRALRVDAATIGGRSGGAEASSHLPVSAVVTIPGRVSKSNGD